MSSGDLRQALDIAGPTEDVHSEDGASTLCDQLPDQAWIGGPRHGIDVAEHRDRSNPLHRVRGSHPCEGRDDHLVARADPRGTRGDLQAVRRVAGGDTVPGSGDFGDLGLELADQRSVVGQPQPVQGPLDTFEEAFPVTDVGPSHV